MIAMALGNLLDSCGPLDSQRFALISFDSSLCICSFIKYVVGFKHKNGAKRKRIWFSIHKGMGLFLFQHKWVSKVLDIKASIIALKFIRINISANKNSITVKWINFVSWWVIINQFQSTMFYSSKHENSNTYVWYTKRGFWHVAMNRHLKNRKCDQNRHRKGNFLSTVGGNEENQDAQWRHQVTGHDGIDNKVPRSSLK